MVTSSIFKMHLLMMMKNYWTDCLSMVDVDSLVVHHQLYGSRLPAPGIRRHYSGELIRTLCDLGAGKLIISCSCTL